uniref:Uncharacterized protein n=1 Tax=Oryza glumipatula TaxID=40148 RepID=A0A0D9YUJ8_9ORYZ
MDPEEIAFGEEPEPPHADGRGGGAATTRAAFLLMVSGATMIIAAVRASAGAGDRVPWPRLLAELLIWLVGCITLFAPSL